MQKSTTSHKSISLIISFLLLLLSYSCEDSANPNNNDIVNKQKTMPYKLWDGFGEYWEKYSTFTGVMFLNAYTREGIRYPSLIQIIAGFDKGYGGEMILSDINIPRLRNIYQQVSPREYDSTDPNKPTFGAVSKWSVAGFDSNDIPGFNTTMYVPKEMYSSVTNVVSDYKLSISDGIDMLWVADEQNKKGVWVWLQYDSDFSRDVDSTLPDEDFYWYKNVPDDGSYCLVLKNLDLPIGGYINVNVFRYNEKFLNVENEIIGIRAQTYSTGLYRLIE